MSGKKKRGATAGKGKGGLQELRRLLVRLGHTEKTNPFPPQSLWQAAHFGQLDSARAFLKRGEDPNGSGESPLYQAAGTGNLDLVNLLLEHGAEVQPKRSISSPLQRAAERGHLAVVNRLLPLCDGAKEKWAISGAARNGQLECLKALWNGGVSQENAGFALVEAIEEGFFNCTKFLLDSGVDPRRHPNYSDPIAKTTPLRAARAKRRKHIIDLLERRRVNETQALSARKRAVDARAHAGFFPADYMKWRREPLPFSPEERPTAIARASEIISAEQKQLRAVLHSDQALLNQSVSTGEIVLVEAMLQADAKPDSASLSAAAEQGFRDIARLLLSNGATLDERPFVVAAAKRDDPELLRMLLEAGADPRGKDQRGMTALTYANGPHGPEIRELIRAGLAAAGTGPQQPALQVKKAKGAPINDSLSGLQCFRSNSPNREWIVVFVRASVESVAEVLARQHKAPRWEKDCAARPLQPATDGLFLFQLVGNKWCVLALAFDWGTEFEQASMQAQDFSRELSTEAVHYGAEDTAGVEGYELFRKGERIENASFDGAKVSFHSKSGKKPRFDTPFPEPRFTELGIVPVPFWISNDGISVALVLGNVRPSTIARLDYIAFKEAPK
jgi:ankyrin repeat protein